MLSTVVTERDGSNLRYVASRHDFSTWAAAPQVGAPLSNVFAADRFAPTLAIEAGKVLLNGPLYDGTGSNALWIPGSTVSWQRALLQRPLNVPAGGAFTYSASNCLVRYIGNEVVYNVNVTGTVTSAPTAGAAADYTLSVPYPVNLGTYAPSTIVGEMWLSVWSATSSNTFKAFARASTDSNAATLRVLAGTAETTLGAVVASNVVNLQGTLTYTTPLLNNANGLPVQYTPAAFVQNQLGAVSLGSGQAPRAQYDVVGTTSNTPVLLVDQQAATGDIVQVRDMGVTKVVVDGNGNVGIGTTAPQGLLHVAGATSNVVVTSQGFVGIGTTVPTASLHVNGSINAKTIYLTNTRTACLTVSTFLSAVPNTTTSSSINVYDYGVPTNTDVCVEITAIAYGSAGSGSGIFKVIVGGYSGHNNTANSAIHPSVILTNSMVNGSWALLNNVSGVYGVSITNTNTNPTSGKDAVVHFIITYVI